MPRKPPRLAAFTFAAWFCLTANPIHADTWSKGRTEPDTTNSGSNGYASRNREQRETFEPPEYKSRGIAFLVSVVGIAAPVSLAAHISGSTHGGSEAWIGGLAAGGMLLGPSLGQVYAGSHKEALVGAGVRAGGALAALLGLSMVADDIFCSYDDGEDCGGSAMGLPLYVAGVVSYAGGTIYSFVNADRSVNRYNESQSRLGSIEWSPILIPGNEGSMRTGAQAYVRFKRRNRLPNAPIRAPTAGRIGSLASIGPGKALERL